MKIDQKQLSEALSLLGALIASEPPMHFVVCGGSSLIALNLVFRVTQDVDVLARVDGEELRIAKPLPEMITKAAGQVAVELDLAKNWFNTGPSDESLFRLGLPPGLFERVTTQDFGPALAISFISRYDQIFFKLYAAADQGGRHFQDLKALGPTAGELVAAARWTQTQDPSEGFAQMLEKVGEALGHDNILEAS